MKNLLQDTRDVLAEHGRTESDVRWVGNSVSWMTWDEFAEHADQEYDEGFGEANVDLTLIVVGDDWWLARGEYDGSEWWEYLRYPIRPTAHSVLAPIHDD